MLPRSRLTDVNASEEKSIAISKVQAQGGLLTSSAKDEQGGVK